jgi:hypothetical protein
MRGEQAAGLGQRRRARVLEWSGFHELNDAPKLPTLAIGAPDYSTMIVNSRGDNGDANCFLTPVSGAENPAGKAIAIVRPTRE